MVPHIEIDLSDASASSPANDSPLDNSALSPTSVEAIPKPHTPLSNSHVVASMDINSSPLSNSSHHSLDNSPTT